MGRPGTFKKGQSGNPGGRPKPTEAQALAREMRALCQPEVVERLLEIARNASDPKDQLVALKALLEEMPKESSVKVSGSVDPALSVSAETLLAVLAKS